MYNFTQVVYFFTQQLVGSYVSQCCVNFLNSGLAVYQLQYMMYLQLNAFMIKLSHIHFEAHHFWEFCDGSFMIVLARPCFNFASIPFCQNFALVPAFVAFWYADKPITALGSASGGFQTNYFLKAVIKAYIKSISMIMVLMFLNKIPVM